MSAIYLVRLNMRRPVVRGGTIPNTKQYGGQPIKDYQEQRVIAYAGTTAQIYKEKL
jgi:hypothetical protein